MTIKLGIVMDPISSINPKKDSSLAMLRAAKKKGWSLFYMEVADLYLDNGVAKASGQDLEVTNDNDDFYELKGERDIDLAELDVILMRKDPPVDSEFITATYILERAERAGVLVVNRAQSLRDCNEKVYATQFPECCPPVFVSRNMNQLRSFVDTHQSVICKPLDGMGGRSIFHVKAGDPNIGVILETLTENGQKQTMAQRYIPEIKEGDKRILIIDGEAVPYALARIPGDGEHRGNLAAGGRGEAIPLSERDKWIVEQIKDDLIARGLIFVGIDVIGDYLTEINVTSPTCIQELDKAYNLDIAGDLMDAIESKISQSAR